MKPLLLREASYECSASSFDEVSHDKSVCNCVVGKYNVSIAEPKRRKSTTTTTMTTMTTTYLPRQLEHQFVKREEHERLDAEHLARLVLELALVELTHDERPQHSRVKVVVHLVRRIERQAIGNLLAVHERLHRVGPLFLHGGLGHAECLREAIIQDLETKHRAPSTEQE